MSSIISSVQAFVNLEVLDDYNYNDDYDDEDHYDHEDDDPSFKGICEPDWELWLEVLHNSLRRQSGGPDDHDGDDDDHEGNHEDDHEDNHEDNNEDDDDDPGNHDGNQLQMDALHSLLAFPSWRRQQICGSQQICTKNCPRIALALWVELST